MIIQSKLKKHNFPLDTQKIVKAVFFVPKEHVDSVKGIAAANSVFEAFGAISI